MSSLSRWPAGRQLSAAAAGQLAALGTVGVAAGLGPVGWSAGLACAAGGGLALREVVRRSGAATLGPAGLVTLARALLVACVAALVAEGLLAGVLLGEGLDPGATALLVGLASVALLLDAVDGRVARRTGTSTALGARFDMETDAVLLLVLSAHVAVALGPWVLAIGLMRYAFVAAAVTAPWLRGALPARLSAKTVAALQGVVLVVAASGLLPQMAAAALVGTALGLLTWSFARDVVLLRRTARPPVPRPEAPPVRIPHPRPPAAAPRPSGLRR